MCLKGICWFCALSTIHTVSPPFRRCHSWGILHGTVSQSIFFLLLGCRSCFWFSNAGWKLCFGGLRTNYANLPIWTVSTSDTVISWLTGCLFKKSTCQSLYCWLNYSHGWHTGCSQEDSSYITPPVSGPNAPATANKQDSVILVYSRHCSGSIEWAKYLHKLFTELSRHKGSLAVRHLPVEVTSYPCTY